MNQNTIPVPARYPGLTEEIMERAPVWDETHEMTALLREVASRLGLTIRELLLWQTTRETRQRDPSMWAKTTPKVLRDWFKSVRAEMERQEGRKLVDDLPRDLKSVRWN